MDTTKILAFRHPSQAELLLESFLLSLHRLPARALRVSARSDLPSALQKIARHTSAKKAHWAAWMKHETIWFFTAELVTAPSGYAPIPALKVSAYNRAGKLEEAGVWVNVPRRGWRRCAL